MRVLTFVLPHTDHLCMLYHRTKLVSMTFNFSLYVIYLKYKLSVITLISTLEIQCNQLFYKLLIKVSQMDPEITKINQCRDNIVFRTYSFLVTNMPTQQSVTILYYESEISMELESLLIKNCQIGDGGRVIIPHSVKQDKLIIAVLLGEVVVLNKLGDRAYKETKVA